MNHHKINNAFKKGIEMEITDIRYYPKKAHPKNDTSFDSNKDKNRTFVGVVDFVIDNKLSINNCFLHKNNEGAASSFRLVYPKPKNDKIDRPYSNPVDKETQEFIDKEISAYIVSNYKTNEN